MIRVIIKTYAIIYSPVSGNIPPSRNTGDAVGVNGDTITDGWGEIKRIGDGEVIGRPRIRLRIDLWKNREP